MTSRSTHGDGGLTGGEHGKFGCPYVTVGHRNSCWIVVLRVSNCEVTRLLYVQCQLWELTTLSAGLFFLRLVECSVASVTVCLPVSVHAQKGKRLELSISNSVDIQCMAGPRRAFILRSNGQRSRSQLRINSPPAWVCGSVFPLLCHQCNVKVKRGRVHTLVVRPGFNCSHCWHCATYERMAGRWVFCTSSSR